MTIFQSLILGIIQGITEFLPVSSSGHLIIIPYLFGWQIQDLSFDIFVHFGTALSVIVFFYKDWVKMIQSLIKDVLSHNVQTSKFTPYSRLLLVIFVAIIPVGIAGVLLENTVKTVFRNPLYVAFMLIIVSFVMFIADRHFGKASKVASNVGISKKLLEIPFTNALMISLSQILALIPGTSRSGITMSTGFFTGLSREDAAKFSFLLATPVIIGAAFLNLKDVFMLSSQDLVVYAFGLIGSFVAGVSSIKFLLKFLAQKSLMVFVVYRIVLAIVIFLTT